MPKSQSTESKRRSSMYEKYEKFDRFQLVIVFIIIGTILYGELTILFIVERVLTSENYSYEWKIFQSHCIGLLICLTVYMIAIIILSILRGKHYKYEKRRKKELPPIILALQQLQKLFSLRSGKYYYHKAFICEAMEIILHIANINEMVSNKDISFVIVASTIISLNFILTPLAYYSIFVYKDAVARTIIFSTDTCLDSAYLITIYIRNFTTI